MIQGSYNLHHRFRHAYVDRRVDHLSFRRRRLPPSSRWNGWMYVYVHVMYMYVLNMYVPSRHPMNMIKKYSWSAVHTSRADWGSSRSVLKMIISKFVVPDVSTIIPFMGQNWWYRRDTRILRNMKFEIVLRSSWRPPPLRSALQGTSRAGRGFLVKRAITSNTHVPF